LEERWRFYYKKDLDINRKHGEWDSFEQSSQKNLDNLNVPKRAISLMWTQRSVDTPIGLPYNIASYALLLKLIAREVGMVPDELICSLGDCHVYQDQVEHALTQITREPYKAPTISIEERYEYSGSKRELSFSEKIDQLEPDWFTTINYEHHTRINYPLSN
jgi:thymidylate synthase